MSSTLIFANYTLRPSTSIYKRRITIAIFLEFYYKE